MFNKACDVCERPIYDNNETCSACVIEKKAQKNMFTKAFHKANKWLLGKVIG